MEIIMVVKDVDNKKRAQYLLLALSYLIKILVAFCRTFSGLLRRNISRYSLSFDTTYSTAEIMVASTFAMVASTFAKNPTFQVYLFV
jgi:hypothetical protein